MINISQLSRPSTTIEFREKRTGIYKVLVPFFHEDGDMYDVFIEEVGADGLIKLCDKGLTLMKLSYSFDIDTPHKWEVLNRIVSQNKCVLEDGEIFLICSYAQFSFAIYQFAQAISKVMNMDILTRELVRSMFFDNLKSYILSLNFPNYRIRESFAPLADDKSLIVDYLIENPDNGKNIFLFGVNDDSKASRVIITCLQFQNRNIRHTSLAVHEDQAKLTRFNRDQLTNVADKQFTSMEAFVQNHAHFMERELA